VIERSVVKSGWKGIQEPPTPKATVITFGPYRSRRGHVTDVLEVDGWVVAAVVSIRSDEGSPSAWQKIAMRFESDDGFLRTIEVKVLGTL
jgi:hypothetical protein